MIVIYPKGTFTGEKQRQTHAIKQRALLALSLVSNMEDDCVGYYFTMMRQETNTHFNDSVWKSAMKPIRCE